MNNILRITLLGAALSLASNLFAQGALTPDISTPTPTMKSLQEIYDRADDAANAVAIEGTEITSLPFTIGDSGYYYLTQDLIHDTADVSAIRILTGPVVLDLRGYTIRSTANVNSRCIDIDSFASGTHIKIINGSIRGSTSAGNFASPRVDAGQGGFDTGISMNLGFGGFLELEDLHISNCSVGGVAVSRARIRNCSFVQNNGIGLYAQESSVYDCFSSDNVGNYEFQSAALYRCVSNSTNGTGFSRTSVNRISLLNDCISIMDAIAVSGQGAYLVENDNSF